jgi:hypothetical protein
MTSLDLYDYKGKVKNIWKISERKDLLGTLTMLS